MFTYKSACEINALPLRMTGPFMQPGAGKESQVCVDPEG